MNMNFEYFGGYTDTSNNTSKNLNLKILFLTYLNDRGITSHTF